MPRTATVTRTLFTFQMHPNPPAAARCTSLDHPQTPDSNANWEIPIHISDILISRAGKPAAGIPVLTCSRLEPLDRFEPLRIDPAGKFFQRIYRICCQFSWLIFSEIAHVLACSPLDFEVLPQLGKHWGTPWLEHQDG